MFGPCFGLNFADRIGFVVEPYGSFDRYSSVIVDGQKCFVESLRLLGPAVEVVEGRCGAARSELIAGSTDRVAGARSVAHFFQ